MRSLRHPEDVLDVALGGSLVMRLGEPLGRDQLVLELGGVAVGERVPVAWAVRSPDPEWPPRRRGRVGQRGGEGGGALHVDRHHRTSLPDLLAQDREQRRRLSRSARPEDQAVGGELALVDRDLAPARVRSQHDRRRRCPSRRGAAPRDRAGRPQPGGRERDPDEHRGSPREGNRHEQRERRERPVRGPARAHRAATGGDRSAARPSARAAAAGGEPTCWT